MWQSHAIMGFEQSPLEKWAETLGDNGESLTESCKAGWSKVGLDQRAMPELFGNPSLRRRRCCGLGSQCTCIIYSKENIAEIETKNGTNSPSQTGNSNAIPEIYMLLLSVESSGHLSITYCAAYLASISGYIF